MAFLDLFNSQKKDIPAILENEFTIWKSTGNYSISDNVFHKYLDIFSPSTILIESLRILSDEQEKDDRFDDFLFDVIETGIQGHLVYSRESYIQFLEIFLSNTVQFNVFLRYFSFSVFFLDLFLLLEQALLIQGEVSKQNEKLVSLLENFLILLPQEGILYRTSREKGIIKEFLLKILSLPIFDNYNSNIGALFGQDELGLYLQKYLSILPDNEIRILKDMFTSMRFHDEKKFTHKIKHHYTNCRKQIGEGVFDRMLEDFGNTIFESKISEIEGSWYLKLQFFSDENESIVRSIIMLLGIFPNQRFLQLLGKLAHKFYRKIPNKGPGSILFGNACVEAIATGYGIDGVSLLFGLSEEVRHPSSKKTIQKWIEKVGITHGLTREELEDKTQKNFGFQDRSLSYPVGDSQIRLMLLDDFSVELIYIGNDSKISRSPSNFIKVNFSEEIKNIKSTKKEIEQFIKYQKKRLEYLMISQRRINYGDFSKNFLQNTSITYLLDGLLFRKIDTRGLEDFIFFDKIQWIHCDNTIVHPESGDILELVHPVQLKKEDRTLLYHWVQEHKKFQIIKQLNREVFYDTTDLSALFLKKLQQHQVVELAIFRGWKASLQGDFDSGETEYKKLYPFCNTQCSIQTEIDMSNMPDSGTGIAYYVSFCSVSWKKYTENGESDIPEEEVPLHILSEALRDIHLFCHIGGRDPNLSIKDFLVSL